jgi:hypothetical protein
MWCTGMVQRAGRCPGPLRRVEGDLAVLEDAEDVRAHGRPHGRPVGLVDPAVVAGQDDGLARAVGSPEAESNEALEGLLSALALLRWSCNDHKGII